MPYSALTSSKDQIIAGILNDLDEDADVSAASSGPNAMIAEMVNFISSGPDVSASDLEEAALIAALLNEVDPSANASHLTSSIPVMLGQLLTFLEPSTIANPHKHYSIEELWARIGNIGLSPGGEEGEITFNANYTLYAPNNPDDWPVGTAVIGGTGTPVWSLASNDGGNFQIDSATGVVSKAVATVLTTGTHNIEIAVSGMTPAAPNLPVAIEVAASLDFRQPGNSALH